MMTTAWPYKLEDYPVEYVNRLKEKWKEPLRILAEDGIKPEDAPLRVMDMGDGMVFTMAPNERSKAERWFFIGKADDEIEQHQDGTFHISYEKDQSEQVCEVLNWCGENIKNGWRFTAWNNTHAGMTDTSYYVEITDHKELTHFLLRWKGNIR